MSDVSTEISDEISATEVPGGILVSAVKIEKEAAVNYEGIVEPLVSFESETDVGIVSTMSYIENDTVSLHFVKPNSYKAQLLNKGQRLAMMGPFENFEQVHGLHGVHKVV